MIDITKVASDKAPIYRVWVDMKIENGLDKPKEFVNRKDAVEYARSLAYRLKTEVRVY